MYNFRMTTAQTAWLRSVIAATCVLLVLVVVMTQRNQFLHSFVIIREGNPAQLGIAACLQAATFVLAAGAYRWLAFRRLRLRELTIVELAAAAVNRLIPSGLGGMGVHGVYLHKRGHSVAQATAVVSANNFLGMLVHMLLLAGALLTLDEEFHLGWHISQGWVLLGIVLGSMILFCVPGLRRRFLRFFHHLLTSLRRYVRTPSSVVLAAALLGCLTVLNVLILYLAMHSLGAHLSPPALFLAYTIGVFAGTIMPTPGGLTGVEAGLAGGLMLFDVHTALALAVAIAFRFVTFWLPILPGLAALAYLRRRKAV